MKYTNALHVLPDKLLKEVQKYASGEALYIPKLQQKKQWGEGSGARQFYETRNEKIREEYKDGAKVDDLANRYGLTEDSIKRIVYQRR